MSLFRYGYEFTWFLHTNAQTHTQTLEILIERMLWFLFPLDLVTGNGFPFELFMRFSFQKKGEKRLSIYFKAELE